MRAFFLQRLKGSMKMGTTDSVFEELDRTASAFKEIDRYKLDLRAPGDYAELVNENDPDGLVQICSASGVRKILMPRDVWEELRKEAQV
jgi:hypothetical protein